MTFRLNHLLLAWLLFDPIPLRSHPASGIAADPSGNVYFVHGNKIIHIDSHGAARILFQDAERTHFHQLHHLHWDGQGHLLTASDTGSGIWKITPGGQSSRYFPPADEDRSVLVGLGGDPFAVDSVGRIVMVNSKQGVFSQLLRVDPTGKLAVIAGGDWGHADGHTSARFGDLHGSAMVFSRDGMLYLSDDGRFIRKVASDGTVSTLCGMLTRGFADGPGNQAQFDGVSGLALQSDGAVIAADYGNHCIRKITPDGITSRFAGSPRRAGKQDGPAEVARFDSPTGIAIGSNHTVYVLEPHGPRVRKILPDGRVSTILHSLPGL